MTLRPANIQVYMCGSIRVCKYVSIHIYASMHVCMNASNYASMQVCTYAWMQVCKSEGMQVCKYLNVEVCKFTYQECKYASKQGYLLSDTCYRLLLTLFSSLVFITCYLWLDTCYLILFMLLDKLLLKNSNQKMSNESEKGWIRSFKNYPHSPPPPYMEPL